MFLSFVNLLKKISNEKNTTVVSIRSDHDSEFQNHKFEKFYNENGISHNFLAPRTPQQNGIVKIKNKTLEEMV